MKMAPTDDDDADVALEQLTREGGDFGGEKGERGHNGRISIAVDEETGVAKTTTEVTRVDAK